MPPPDDTPPPTWLRRLKGHPRSPPGWEWRLWRRLPALALWGTVPPLALAGWLIGWPEAWLGTRQALWLAYVLIGVVVLHWTLLLTVGIGCWIVRLMKGPAYVADAYPMQERDVPLR